MSRDHLIDLIDRNSAAILSEARGHVQALDRRSYTAMSPDAAAAEYAYDEGLAEIAGEVRKTAWNSVYVDIRKLLDDRGMACLPADERAAVSNDSDFCEQCYELGMLVIDKSGFVADKRARVLDIAARAVADMRVPE